MTSQSDEYKSPLDGPFGQPTTLGVGMVASFDAAHDAAKAQLTDARAAKAHDSEELQHVIATAFAENAASSEQHGSSSSSSGVAGPSGHSVQALRDWAIKLAEDDEHLREAEALVEHTAMTRSRAKKAYRMQWESAEERATAQRLASQLREVRSQFEAATLRAQEAEAAAAQAAAEVVREATRTPSAGKCKAPMACPPPGSAESGSSAAGGGGATSADTSPSVSPAPTWDHTEHGIPKASSTERSDAPRSFRSELYSPRLLSLGERGMIRGPSGRAYQSTSLFTLLPGQPPRSWAILTVESPLFDPVILLTILANCVTMAWESPLDPCCTWKAQMIARCDAVFLAIFTWEMGTKITAYGFLMHRGSYLRDPWCQLDFVVVTLAWLPILFPQFGNYSVLRAFRALRPLRALKRVPGMPLLIQWILDVMPKMANVMMLCGFVFLIFGIVGLELFKGALHYRCALPGFVPSADHPGFVRRMLLGFSLPDGETLNTWGGGDGSQARNAAVDAAASQVPFDTVITCDPTDPVRCDLDAPGSTCEYFDANPYQGIESFDSVPLAFVALMQSVTFDAWADPMYDLMGYYGPGVSAFFVLIVVFGGFFIVNLFLAVIFLEYSSSKREIADGADTARSNASSNFSSRASPAITSRSGDAAAASATAGLLTPSAALSDGTSKAAAGLRGSPISPSRRAPHRKRGWCDCQPSPGSWRYPFTLVATSDALSLIATSLVLLNMLVMCLPYYGMSEEYAASLEFYSSIITWIFIVEMSVKLLGLGCQTYWADGWNQLDGSIVIMSIVEMIVTAILAGGGVNISFLRMLRMLRILRILRLMRSWKGLYNIVMTFASALPQMGNIAFLTILTMFIFSLLGMQIFGGIYNGRVKPRAHFDYIGPAMIGVFVILTGEWVDVMHPATTVMGSGAAMFFVIAVIIGKYLLLNMLIAVVLDEFSSRRDLEDHSVPPAGATSRAASRVAHAQKLMASSPSPMTPQTEKPVWHLTTEHLGSPTRVMATVRIDGVLRAEGTLGAFQMHQVCGVAQQQTPGDGSSSPDGQPPSGPADAVFVIDVYASHYGHLPTEFVFRAGGEAIPLEPAVALTGQGSLGTHAAPVELEGFMKSPPWPLDWSLCCFPPNNSVRRGCRWLLKQPLFDSFIIAVILVSSVCLALDVPRLDLDSPLAAWLSRLDHIFTAIFFTEMMVKVIAFGFAWGENAYIKSLWNQLDFAIVMVSLLLLLAESIPQLQGLRVLRMLRVLRPLRVVSRNAGMKLIIMSLFETMPAVSEVFAVVLALQLVFAILGMQLFSGMLATCSDPTILTEVECVGTAAAKAAAGQRELAWTNPAIGSFDHFWDAMLLLYVMSSGDEWEGIMYKMMDTTSAGHAPARNDFSGASVFAIIWMFVGSICAMNLVVGVVVDDFSRKQKQEDGSAILTPAQQQWVSTMGKLRNVVPLSAVRPPAKGYRRDVYRFVMAPAFDGFITLVIVLNIGLMACDYWGIEQDETRMVYYNHAMLSFNFIYYFECIVKLIALGADGYFGDSWCRFDFFLVCMSLIDQFATELLAKYLPLPPMLLRVLRVFRILRILRLLRGAKELRNLIVTMVLSLPSLLNVSSLLALLIFIYTVLGVQLFTYVAPGEAIDDERNFHTIGSAALLLFQCLTGDGWSNLMTDAMRTEASGDCSDAEGNCGSLAAIPYFISYQLVGCFIFLNLVVAVIIENFATLHGTNPGLVSSFDLDLFQEAWASFDPDATNFIPSSQFIPFLLSFPRPLGLKGSTEKQAERMVLNLGVPQHEGCVAYWEVLNELIENNYFRSGSAASGGGLHAALTAGGGFCKDEFKGSLDEAGIADKLDLSAPVATKELTQTVLEDMQKNKAFKGHKPVALGQQTVANHIAFNVIDRNIDASVINAWRRKQYSPGGPKASLANLATNAASDKQRKPASCGAPAMPSSSPPKPRASRRTIAPDGGDDDADAPLLQPPDFLLFDDTPRSNRRSMRSPFRPSASGGTSRLSRAAMAPVTLVRNAVRRVSVSPSRVERLV